MDIKDIIERMQAWAKPGMRMFDGRVSRVENITAQRAAIAYALSGGQGLHVWDPDLYGWRERPAIPRVFAESKPWAHLFDQDEERVKTTARLLGVNIVVLGGKGRRTQHVDLVAAPLKRAMLLAKLYDAAGVSLT